MKPSIVSAIWTAVAAPIAVTSAVAGLLLSGLPQGVHAQGFADVGLSEVRSAPPGHDTDFVIGGMARAARDAQTFRAQIQVAEYVPVKKKSKEHKWRVQNGQIEVAKGKGARLMLRRDANRYREFTANPRQLLEYESRKNRISTLPATLPIVSGLVKRALDFDPTLLTDADSLRLEGIQTVGGTAAYRLEGSTPSRYAAFGLKRQPVRIWLRQSDFSPIRIELPNLDQTTINLTAIERNRPISPGRFEFRHPPGATVKRVLGL
jgi:outer membrane lipoprotein-sorting protein